MTATYDPTLRGARTQLRELLGDTVPDEALLSDVQLDAWLVEQGSVALAAAYAAHLLVARFAARPVVISVDGEVTADYRGRIAAWQALAARLEASVPIVPDPNAPPAPGSAVPSRSVATEASW